MSGLKIMFAHRWRLINERLENKPFLFISERVILYFRTAKCLKHKIQEMRMEVKQGYAYHIKDEYFEFAHDSNLMQNKERGNYRPTLYCVPDSNSGIYWMIPISSQYDKFLAIKEKIITKGKPCKGIVLGEFDDRKAAFLLQNMFPVTEQYLDHIHTKNGNPVPVKQVLQSEIQKNVKFLLALNAKGVKVTFTDITRLKNKLLEVEGR